MVWSFTDKFKQNIVIVNNDDSYLKYITNIVRIQNVSFSDIILKSNYFTLVLITMVHNCLVNHLILILYNFVEYN